MSRNQKSMMMMKYGDDDDDDETKVLHNNNDTKNNINTTNSGHGIHGSTRRSRCPEEIMHQQDERWKNFVPLVASTMGRDADRRTFMHQVELLITRNDASDSAENKKPKNTAANDQNNNNNENNTSTDNFGLYVWQMFNPNPSSPHYQVGSQIESVVKSHIHFAHHFSSLLPTTPNIVAGLCDLFRAVTNFNMSQNQPVMTVIAGFRLEQMKKFLQLEAFAVNQNDLSAVVHPIVPNNVDKKEMYEGCWIAYLATNNAMNLDDNLKASVSNDSVYSTTANAIISYYDRCREDRGFDLGDITNTWRKKIPGNWSAFPILASFGVVISANNANLMHLLANDEQVHDILSIAQDHFTRRVTTRHDDLKDFYQNRSVVVTSLWLSNYTARRFVRPYSSLELLALTPTEFQSTEQPESAKVNIVSGWSGAGKSSAATLPLRIAQSKPICVVFSAREIFSDLSSTDDPSSFNTSPFDTNSHFNTLSGSVRDCHAARLFVKGLLTAFGHSVDHASSIASRHTDIARCSVKTVKKLDGSNNLVNVTVPDLTNFFDDDVEQALAGRINSDFVNDNEFRAVIDEAGSCHGFVHAMCNIWEELRLFLKRIFRIADIDKIFLYVVGSGAEAISLPTKGWTYPHDYAIFTVTSAPLFSSLLFSQTSMANPARGQPVNGLYDKLFAALFEIKEDAANANTKSIRARGSTHDARTFLHIVSDNARCAALGMRLIMQFVADHSATFDFMMCHLPTWSVEISAKFVMLNGLSKSPAPFVEIGRALRIVMSHTHADLSPEESTDFLVDFGILIDTKTAMRRFSPPRAPAQHHTTTPGAIIIPANQQLDPHRPRYRVQQSFVTMFLLDRGLVLSNDYLNADESFEHLVANHHALCLVLRPRIVPQSPSSLKLFADVTIAPGAPVDTVVLRSRLSDPDVTANDAANMINDPRNHPLRESSNKKLHKMFGDAAAKWKDTVRQGGAVVIIPGAETPNADVFVLTQGKLFASQCKYYQPSNTLSEKQVKEELAKILTSPQNFFTRRLLRQCCAVGTSEDAVVMVASIIVLSNGTLTPFFSARSNHNEKLVDGQMIDATGRGAFADGSVRQSWNVRLDDSSLKTVEENFDYKIRFICAVDAGTTAGASHSLDFANDGTKSQLYPMLTSALDKAHLAKVEKQPIIQQKSRQALNL